MGGEEKSPSKSIKKSSRNNLLKGVKSSKRDFDGKQRESLDKLNENKQNLQSLGLLQSFEDIERSRLITI